MYETVASPYLRAARVPETFPEVEFGPWRIMRQRGLDPITRFIVGGTYLTVLCRTTEATMHLVHGEVVMEDSARELRRHLPIFLAAHGRVLKTGLGLGCVVRGLLIKPEIEHIDVVEIDRDIITLIGAEFEGNPRVTIHHADALTWEFGERRWDFAWHDIWCEGNHGLEMLHAELICRYAPAVGLQGAWAFPRLASRILNRPLLGAPRFRQKHRGEDR